MELLLADNGVGIEKEDLKHILNGSISVTKDGLKRKRSWSFYCPSACRKDGWEHNS